MARRSAATKTRATPADDAAGDVEPADQLAPVVATEPEGVDRRAEPAEAHEPAPVYPTERDELEAIAEVAERDPHLTTHALARAVRAQLDANASRAARRRNALARVAVEHAPMFPTEAHIADLRDAIPSISDDELRAVVHAGFAAYLASLDAREPVLIAPDQE